MSANATDFLGIQLGSAGVALGPKQLASFFTPVGMGLVLASTDNRQWLLRLALNPDGTTYYSPEGEPTIELVEVTL